MATKAQGGGRIRLEKFRLRDCSQGLLLSEGVLWPEEVALPCEALGGESNGWMGRGRLTSTQWNGET